LNVFGATKTFHMHNPGNRPIDVICYWIVPRRILSDDEDPLQIWQGQVSTTYSGITDPELVPGLHPFMFKQWTDKFRVFKTRQFVLDPGQDRVVAMHRRKYFRYSSAKYGKDTTDVQFLPGISQFLMVRIRGHLAHDATSESEINFGPATLHVLETMKARVNLENNTLAEINIAGGYGTIGTAEARLDVEMDEENIQAS